MTIMRAALENTLADDARGAYWDGRWATFTRFAAGRVKQNREHFYTIRLVATLSAVIVPALVGLNLAGAGGAAVRWCTFSLSLVAAVSTAVLGVFRYGDRWNLYRDLQTELLAAAWSLLNTGCERDSEWATFTRRTENAIAKYNGAYDSDLIKSGTPRAGAEGGDDPQSN
jgi:hypothetical protein